MTVIKDTTDLLAAVPFIVGFEPKESTVVIGVDDTEDGIKFAIRFDYATDDDDDFRSEMNRLSKIIKSNGAETILVIMYAPDDIGKFEATLVATLYGTVFSRNDIALQELIVVHQGKYKSLLCQDPTCCNPGWTQIQDLAETRIAMEKVLEGTVMPFKTVDELENHYSPKITDQMLVDILQHAEELKDMDDYRAVINLYHVLLEEFELNKEIHNRDAIADLLIGLKNIQVRDYAMGAVYPETRENIKDFLLWLLNRTPAGYVAPVACLLALLKFEDGDGATARVLVDIALEDDESYSLAGLFRRSFQGGLSPETIQAMRDELHPRVIKQLQE